MSEVDVISEKLQAQHDGKYTQEQLRAWAHMLQMKKHQSYDMPPNKPFFRNKKTVLETGKIVLASHLGRESTCALSVLSSLTSGMLSLKKEPSQVINTRNFNPLLWMILGSIENLLGKTDTCNQT